ncbi:hypothetical protein MRB53_038877 [Persea americana]|nr:hypothetical protein MRB53_038877 [Persea americana]
MTVLQISQFVVHRASLLSLEAANGQTQIILDGRFNNRSLCASEQQATFSCQTIDWRLESWIGRIVSGLEPSPSDIHDGLQQRFFEHSSNHSNSS